MLAALSFRKYLRLCRSDNVGISPNFTATTTAKYWFLCTGFRFVLSNALLPTGLGHLSAVLVTVAIGSVAFITSVKCPCSTVLATSTSVRIGLNSIQIVYFLFNLHSKSQYCRSGTSFVVLVAELVPCIKPVTIIGGNVIYNVVWDARF
jgi:hypothetical protein